MSWQDELKAIQKSNPELLLTPGDVVTFAGDPDTALHGKFEWNDSKAAHAHRLWQARQLIVKVTILDSGDGEPGQAFVSLSPDRGAGGYRSSKDVLSSEEMRLQLVKDALTDFRLFRVKYYRVKELAALWAAGDQIQKEVDGKRKRKE